MITVSRIKGYLIGHFRRAWRFYSDERKTVFKRCQTSKGFRCEGCGKVVSRTRFAIDHVEPVVSPEEGFIGWDNYYKRLFVDASKLQGLCKFPCHSKKSGKENKERWKMKKLLSIKKTDKE